MKNQKYPICEVCAQYPATSFSWFCNHDGEAPLTGKWKFVCGCTSGVETYYVEFDCFFESPTKTAEWLTHLSEKTWMDWDDWHAMMGRFSDEATLMTFGSKIMRGKA